MHNRYYFSDIDDHLLQMVWDSVIEVHVCWIPHYFHSSSSIVVVFCNVIIIVAIWYNNYYCTIICHHFYFCLMSHLVSIINMNTYFLQLWHAITSLHPYCQHLPLCSYHKRIFPLVLHKINPYIYDWLDCTITLIRSCERVITTLQS